MEKIKRENKAVIPKDWILVFVRKVYHKLKIRDSIINSQLGRDDGEIIIKIDLNEARDKIKDSYLLMHIKKAFRENPKKTHKRFRECITTIYNDSLPKDKFLSIHEDSLKFRLEKENLVLIYKNIDDFLQIKRIENDFQKDWHLCIGKFVEVQGYFGNFRLQKEIFSKEIVYKCLSCSLKQPPLRQKLFAPQRYPDICIRPKCNNKTQKKFEEVQEESNIIEIRTFDIIDKNQNTIKCVISKGCNYFEEFIIQKNIKLRQLLKITGTLWTFKIENTANKEYYIKVNNIEPATEVFELDEKIISELKEDQRKDSSFFEGVIDNIFKLTRGIYEFFKVKLLISCAVISSDSWIINENYRNSLNVIFGGCGGTYKSSTLRKFREILGDSNFGLIKGGSITEHGLVPVTQRSNKIKDLIRRLGALAFYSTRTLAIDEAQYMRLKAKIDLKNLDDGVIPKSSDGEIINAEVKGSVILSLNFNSQDNFYDYSKTLAENVCFPEDQISILERFDLFNPIPRQSKVVNKIIFERSLKKNYRDGVSENYIYNYLIEAKKLYSNGIKLSEGLVILFRNLYESYLNTSPDNILKQRDINVLKKVVKVVASMKFKEVADISDLNFVKKHLIDTVIPLRNQKFINTNRIIDIKEVFIRTFKYLAELKSIFFIEEHIRLIREFLEIHYFSESKFERDVTREEFSKMFPNDSSKDQIITDVNYYMSGDTGLNKNHQYRELIKDKGIIDSVNKYGYIIGIINKKTSFIKKSLMSEVYNRIVKIIKSNRNKLVEIESVIEVLSIDFEEKFLFWIINMLVKEKKNLLKNSKNELFLKK